MNDLARKLAELRVVQRALQAANEELVTTVRSALRDYRVSVQGYAAAVEQTSQRRLLVRARRPRR